jgi:hypothetical protein
MSIIEYHTSDGDKNNADDFLFYTEEKFVSAREKYNRFLYEDFCFEIFGNSPMMYTNLNLDIQKLVYENKDIEFILFSDENQFSIAPTLFFLSKNNFKFKKISFIENYNEVWNEVDIYITSNPEILKNKAPFGKEIIKVKRPYNIDIPNNYLEILHVKDLLSNEFKELANNKILNKIKRYIK